MASSGAKCVGAAVRLGFPWLLALAGCAGLSPAEVHTNAGVALHEEGRYERAIAEYDEAIRSDAEFALAYYNRGVAYARLSEFERAVGDYDESIRLDPRRAEAFRGRALAYSALGQQARAAEDYREATRLSRRPDVVNDGSNTPDDYLGLAMDLLSSYAPRVVAALGTGLIGLAMLVGSVRLRRWMERPMLRPNARLDYLHDLQGPGGVLTLFLEARNPHSIAVTVQSLGLELGSGPNPLLVVTPQAGYVFPHAVKKGESIIEWTDVPRLLQMLNDRGSAPSDLKWVWFGTSSGERHRARIDRKVIEGLSNLAAAATTRAGESRPRDDADPALRTE